MPDDIPPLTVLLKLSICSCKIKFITNRRRYSKYDLQCTDILVVKITAPSDILAVMTMKKNIIFKIIKPFFMFTVSLFIHVTFMGSFKSLEFVYLDKSGILLDLL